MEMDVVNILPSRTLPSSISESIVQSSIAAISMEGVSVLTSDSGPSANLSNSQFINVPLLQDASIAGTDPRQSYIIATSADGNTILVDASQLAVLTEQSIPLYDGTNLFQVASETTVESTAAIRTESEVLNDSEQIKVNNLQNTSSAQFVDPRDGDEILPPDKRGPHKCFICGLEFVEAKQLRRHWKCHAEDKPNRCEECNASFNKRSNLLLHQATHCTSDPTCPECKKKFSRMASLKAHLMLHETEENLVCTECGDEFSTQFKLDKHMQNHMAEMAVDKSFVCRTCMKRFGKLKHLREHMKIHYKLKASLHHRVYKKNIDRSSFSHKCYFCGKQFQKPSQLIRHNRIHTGERPFKCEVCNRAFNQKGALLIHMVKHTGERAHLCQFCPSSFAQKGNLRNHIRRVHSLMAMENTEGVHKCELCSCAFKKLGSLNAHMSRVHSSSVVSFVQISDTDKPEDTVTSQVNNVINQLLEMSKHAENNELDQKNEKTIAADNGESADILQQALENSGLANNQPALNKSKPWLFSMCDSATGTINKHIMRNVGGVRWYQCVYCAKEFKKPSDLVRHIRIHTHEKPYKCDMCFRAFAVKSTLNAHLRTHSGTKDFSCEHCKKLFSTSGSLKVHLLLHTGAKPFVCTLCSRSFRTSGHRNSHMQSHQKEKTARKPKKTIKISQVNDINVANIPLQEPILITDAGLVQPVSKNSTMYNQFIENEYPSERPYRCVVCQRGFKKSSHLKQHLRSHTGEKPFKCNQCHRAFVSNGVLKAHFKTHSGVKAYNCDICHTSFTTNGSLKRHMCIHSNDRPYMCPYCQKTFKTSMNCKKHMKTHRYELALGLAAGVSVTVISDGVVGLQSQEVGEKESSGAAGPIIENGQAASVENSGQLQPLITLPQSFELDRENGITETPSLSQIPQYLSQEVFNTQTGMIEQAVVVSQAPPFEQTQNNIYLPGSDFVGNHLTLQPEVPSESLVSSTTIVNSLVSGNISKILQSQESNVENVEALDEIRNNVESRDNIVNSNKKVKTPFKCLQCDKVFKKSHYLKQHSLSHTGEKPYRCSKCGSMFGSMRVLTAHIKTHDGTKEFKCTECESAFSSKRSLVRHMNIHDPNRSFHCSYCTETFSTKNELQLHLNQYHEASNSQVEETTTELVNPNPSLPLTEESPEQIVMTSSVEDHQLIESIKLIRRCTPVFHEKDTIPERVIIPEQSEFCPKFLHVCSRCPKSFKKPSDLVRHMRIHTGEKPYTCESCGKSFTVKSTLDSHVKTHTGEKNFSCHVCCSLFATKGSLKVHMRLHTGVRPFKCPHCDLHFRTSGHRKSHMTSHFKDSIIRKRKKPRNAETQASNMEKEPQQQAETLPKVALAEEVVSITQAESCNEIQIPQVSNEDIQLQLASPVVGQNIQIATLDHPLLSKPIQIDAALLQQLQQHININITLSPNLTEQLNSQKVAETSQPQQILNINATTPPIPVSSGAFTINPMVIHQLGFSVNPSMQTDVQTETFTLNLIDHNLPKNSEVFQTTEIADSQTLIIEGNTDNLVLNKDNSNTVFVTESNNLNDYQTINPSSLQHSTKQVHSCTSSKRTFKTIGQLNGHMASHKMSKCTYRCEDCNKDFKKRYHFLKHMQIHS